MTVEIGLTVASPASIESGKLSRHFGRFDSLFFLICTIVGVDTIASVASDGGEAFTWMLIFAIVFFVPQALLFAELGTAFPQEGGPYLWTRLAFGHLVGAINNFMYWVTNPVWLGGTLAISAVTAFSVFFNGGKDFADPVTIVIAIVFIWVGVLAAVLSFKVGKWITTAGAVARFLLLGWFTVTVVLYAVERGFHGLAVGDFTPSASGFVAVIGVLLFNYVGFELPSSAGEEMKDPARHVPFAIARSTVFSFLLYAVPILGILLVLPVSSVTNFSGFVDAIQKVFLVYGPGSAVAGGIGCILFVICLLTSGVTWIMGSDRALAVSGYDGAAPRFLGVISAKLGTPVRVNIFSGIVATIIFVLAHYITQGSTAKFFGAVLGVTISTTLISYLLIYPALWKLRKSQPNTPRPFRMPWVPFFTILLMILLSVSVIQLIAPGLGSELLPGGTLWGGSAHWFSSDFMPGGGT